MTDSPNHPSQSSWRANLHEVIFEADTPAGKAFDILLIASIFLSVGAVVLESVAGIQQRFGSVLYGIEWFFTGLFTIEYLLRLICVGRPIRYATSFFGIVDLLAIVPTYLSIFIPGSQSLLTIRLLRLLRIFRVLKLTVYVKESRLLTTALWASRRKIGVFLFAVLTVVVVIGAVMYVIEGRENGFTDIPTSIYWAIVTLTTVGYGDLSPQTPVGKALASLVMIMGYGIIAVPTGIVTVEMTHATRRSVSTQACPECSLSGHDADAVHCKHCGAKL